VQEEAAEDSDAIVRGAVEFLVKQCEDTGASPPLPEEGKEGKEAAEDAEEEAMKQVDDGSEMKEEKEGGEPEQSQLNRRREGRDGLTKGEREDVVNRMRVSEDTVLRRRRASRFVETTLCLPLQMQY